MGQTAYSHVTLDNRTPSARLLVRTLRSRRYPVRNVRHITLIYFIDDPAYMDYDSLHLRQWLIRLSPDRIRTFRAIGNHRALRSIMLPIPHVEICYLDVPSSSERVHDILTPSILDDSQLLPLLHDVIHAAAPTVAGLTHLFKFPSPTSHTPFLAYLQEFLGIVHNTCPDYDQVILEISYNQTPSFGKYTSIGNLIQTAWTCACKDARQLQFLTAAVAQRGDLREMVLYARWRPPFIPTSFVQLLQEAHSAGRRLPLWMRARAAHGPTLHGFDACSNCGSCFKFLRVYEAAKGNGPT